MLYFCKCAPPSSDWPSSFCPQTSKHHLLFYVHHLVFLCRLNSWGLRRAHSSWGLTTGTCSKALPQQLAITGELPACEPSVSAYFQSALPCKKAPYCQHCRLCWHSFLSFKDVTGRDRTASYPICWSFGPLTFLLHFGDLHTKWRVHRFALMIQTLLLWMESRHQITAWLIPRLPLLCMLWWRPMHHIPTGLMQRIFHPCHGLCA